MTEPFGVTLRRLRLAVGYSQNGLAHAARIDPAYVHQLEHGHRCAPSRAVTDRLCTALGLDDLDTATLLVAAGLWPWPELDEQDTAIALGVLLAIRDGDVRRLDGVAALEVLR